MSADLAEFYARRADVFAARARVVEAGQRYRRTRDPADREALREAYDQWSALDDSVEPFLRSDTPTRRMMKAFAQCPECLGEGWIRIPCPTCTDG